MMPCVKIERTCEGVTREQQQVLVNAEKAWIADTENKDPLVTRRATGEADLMTVDTAANRIQF